MIKVKLGQVVPISLQLVDLSPDETVKCFIYSDKKELLETVQLTHFKYGYYYYDKFVMPDVPYLIVIHTVTSSNKYEAIAEHFYLEKQPKQAKIFTGKMYKTTENGFLVGRIL